MLRLYSVFSILLSSLGYVIQVAMFKNHDLPYLGILGPAINTRHCEH